MSKLFNRIIIVKYNAASHASPIEKRPSTPATTTPCGCGEDCSSCERSNCLVNRRMMYLYQCPFIESTTFFIRPHDLSNLVWSLPIPRPIARNVRNAAAWTNGAVGAWSVRIAKTAQRVRTS